MVPASDSFQQTCNFAEQGNRLLKGSRRCGSRTALQAFRNQYQGQPPYGDDGGVISNVFYIVYGGKNACGVKGYPNLSTYDAAGKPLSTRVSHESGDNYSNVPFSKETTVVLSPKGRRAWFLIEAAGVRYRCEGQNRFAQLPIVVANA